MNNSLQSRLNRRDTSCQNQSSTKTVHKAQVYITALDRDIGTDYERIADHCSNIAVGIIEVDEDAYDAHGYIEQLKANKGEDFEKAVEFYQNKYLLPAVKF